jgi:uncharacterized membrane protein
VIYFSIIIGIIAWIVIAFWPARWASKKGYNFFVFLVLSWFISFILTLIIVAFLDDKNKTPESRDADRAVDEAMKSEREQS